MHLKAAQIFTSKWYSPLYICYIIDYYTVFIFQKVELNGGGGESLISQDTDLTAFMNLSDYLRLEDSGTLTYYVILFSFGS